MENIYQVLRRTSEDPRLLAGSAPGNNRSTPQLTGYRYSSKRYFAPNSNA
jgi:hypothetical protein